MNNLFDMLAEMNDPIPIDSSEDIAVAFLGSKYKIWKELCSVFPATGRRYIELFAGRGNVFFNFKPHALYREWILNDKYTGKFFQALKTVDLNLLPDRYVIDNGEFELWRQRAAINDPIALVLEPYITFQGVGYQFGVGDLYRKQYDTIINNLKIMQQRLHSVSISVLDYVYVDIANLTHNDFIYCDPPYVGCKDRVFPNIDHVEFLQFITSTHAKWAISGYEDELYLQGLGEPRLRLTKRLTSSGKGNSATECLWTNY